MNIERRQFLKTSLVASAAAAVATRADAASATSSASKSGREYYDLRCYRLKPGASHAALDAYLEKALLPALDQRGVKNVGVFSELDVNKNAATSTPKADSPLWVLIPYSNLDTYVSISADLLRDAAIVKAGDEYLQAKKATPAFDRIDSWLYLAFEGFPKLQAPSFTKSRTRVYEMRDYESHSELKALSKMDMFNQGEIEVMKDLGMSPVFYGQGIAGPNLPHLRYITGAADLATHLNNWKKFGPDPRWQKMKDLPQYADNTSKNTARFVAPTAYSQL